MNEKMRKYAKLLVGLGVNLQPGQHLLLDIDTENYELARMIAEVAMEAGAADVIVHWTDAWLDRTLAAYSQRDDLAAVAPWESESYGMYIEEGACSLRVISAYPTVFEGVDKEKAAQVQLHSNNTRNILRKGTAEKGMHWCIATAPCKNWAQYLFPQETPDEAVNHLWDVLFRVCLIDENDPIQNWLNSMGKNGKYADILNAHTIDTIRFTNGSGTDLTIGFEPGVHWVGAAGGEYNAEMYLPNIPTAEVSTSPSKFRVNGTVTASRSMMAHGAIISDFGFTFRDGKVVDFFAKEGYEALKALLDTDEGARYLGEVAFVECDSPLAQTGLLFLNTLLDENAACHLALGRGFNILFPNLSGTDYEAWDKVNLNHSQIHVDFMFGTEDMTAEVQLTDGRKGEIFVNGKFNPDVSFC